MAFNCVCRIGSKRAMSRVFSIGTALVLIGGALAGCSASLPNWMSATSSTPPPQPLQFQSEPPAADVRTAQGQTCQTPCSLTVPSENQAIIFTKNGFLPQTVQIAVGAPPEHSLFESAPPPSLTLNPVVVTLQPVAPPKRAVKHRPPKPVLKPAPRPSAAPTTEKPSASPPPKQ